jgi:hypothetical protein
MIFDTETAILATLRAHCPPESVLLGTFDPVDLTDSASSPVIGQVALQQIASAGESRGLAAAVHLIYAFSVYCDVLRATTDQKLAAAALLESAANALVVWEYAPMRTPRIIDGQSSEFDGRILRLSIGFSIPAFFGAQ